VKVAISISNTRANAIKAVISTRYLKAAQRIVTDLLFSRNGDYIFLKRQETVTIL
jgi:hypothetical protein